MHSQSQTVTDEKIKEMKDQIIRAKAYLNFAPPGSNSHLVKELRLRIKEVERAVGDHTKDSDLSRRYKLSPSLSIFFPLLENNSCCKRNTNSLIDKENRMLDFISMSEFG